MRDSFLAVIPARGGSKGLPQKNILKCAGKPLIGWTIGAALSCSRIDKVLVSTDCAEIASVSSELGAHVPFLRPPELAEDSSSMVDVLRHAWENCFDNNNQRYSHVVLLQPTSPLRSVSHIKSALDYYSEIGSGADTLVSVYRAPEKSGWLMSPDSNDERYIKFCFDVSSGNPMRQRLKQYFMPNGALYIARGECLDAGLYSPRTLFYVMSFEDSIDIDTKAEFDQAEKILLSRASAVQ